MNYGQAGTSIEATIMDVDPRQPFVHTGKNVTPLYTESQESGHTNVNTS